MCMYIAKLTLLNRHIGEIYEYKISIFVTI